MINKLSFTPNRELIFRDNSFDALRVLAAGLVLFSHSWPIGLGLKDPLIFGVPVGTVGVYIFFALSGFLINHSAKRSKSAVSFFRSRALRIYPGLAICVIASTFIMGPIISTLSPSDYFSSQETYKYLFNVSAIKLEAILPGTLANNHIKTVNGSLWTLPYEIFFYFFFYLLVKIRDKASTPTLMLIALFCANHFVDDSTPRHLANIAKLGPAFCTGAIISYIPINFKNLLKTLLVGLAFFFIAALLENGRLYNAVISAGLGSSCIAIAYIAPNLRITPPSLGDISYGLYIYAFPVQQVLRMIIEPTGLGVNFIIYIVISFFCTAALAILSWHAIERRALLYK